GVCAVAFGESDAELEAELRREFPRAVLEHAPDELGPWVAAVVALVEGEVARVDVPLDLRATAFQQRVWKALREIPPGETRTYGEVAKAIGEPRAARAVARACASNRVAVVVPCHRVVPSAAGAGVGGYRWGVGREGVVAGGGGGGGGWGGRGGGWRGGGGGVGRGGGCDWRRGVWFPGSWAVVAAADRGAARAPGGVGATGGQGRGLCFGWRRSG